MQKVNDLRKSFLGFFEERDHRIVPSSSLVPKDDPTLLFTTAGMVQFKPMFAGTVDLEYTRAASVQKCMRTSDLENVGKTKRHLTFFEMLGNFSFGDYFKEEAIRYAWDYSTETIGFPREKIWISIYRDDDEAFELWEKTGVPDEKIVRLGKKDNFWGPAGDSGACGPCSELYLDRGKEYGCGSPDCKPGCDCERFLEYWNLVFNQFNQDLDGNLHPLPQTGIDTGMGLERLATLVQGVDSVYETDEFVNLIEFVSKKSGVKYEGKNIDPIRVIVEHARSLTFAMSDGIYPSNDGRGYVLRRVLRRALRYCRQIGLHDPFLYTIVDPIVESIGSFYPEIKAPAANIKKVIESEEKRFLETLENGMDRLEEIMKAGKKSDRGIIPGKDLFLLYDTFGFPVEMTMEIAGENGLEVDTAGFEKEMDEQRNRGKQSWKGSENGLEKSFEKIAASTGDTEFLGYEKDITEAKIKLIYRDNKPVDKISNGDRALLVLDKTTFYGESGGQAGDTGTIHTGRESVFRVDDTRKYHKTVIHLGEIISGTLKINDTVTAEINTLKRNLTRANHTATHLLQKALLIVLGEHVKQAGSLVETDRFRFDFSHFDAMTKEEIMRVEEIVNEKIWENIRVETEITKMEDAVKAGAIAVFDEKYEDIVRVVKVGDFSRELCGGTHVSQTGNIGVFKILKESSPGAGMRRIEGVTLKGLLDRFSSHDNIISQLSSTMSVSEEDIVRRYEDMVERTKSLEKEIQKLKKGNISSELDAVISSARDVNGVKIVSHLFKDVNAGHLRDLSDSVRAKEQNSVVCFGSEYEGKALLLFAATKNSVERGADCGKLIKEVSKHVGGGGGGRRDLAQAGGKYPEGLEKAISEGVKAAEKMVK